MSSQVTAAVIAGLVAIVIAYLGSRWEIRRQAIQLRSEIERETARAQRDLELEITRSQRDLRLQEERLKAELRTEFMAEQAIHLLLKESTPLRSFERIQARVGGFDGNELRRLLVRSGALRYWSKDGKTEYWGLRERNENGPEDRN